MSAEALNLEAIQKALDVHDRPGGCPWPVTEIRMCQFEIDRLGWDEYRGIKILPDDNMGTGRFRLVCNPEDAGEEHVLSVEEMQPRETVSV